MTQVAGFLALPLGVLGPWRPSRLDQAGSPSWLHSAAAGKSGLQSALSIQTVAPLLGLQVAVKSQEECTLPQCLACLMTETTARAHLTPAATLCARQSSFLQRDGEVLTQTSSFTRRIGKTASPPSLVFSPAQKASSCQRQRGDLLFGWAVAEHARKYRFQEQCTFPPILII